MFSVTRSIHLYFKHYFVCALLNVATPSSPEESGYNANDSPDEEMAEEVPEAEAKRLSEGGITTRYVVCT